MIDQLQRHFIITRWAKQRVFAEAVEETLLKGLGRQNPVASGIGGYVGRDDLSQVFSHLLVTYIAVKSVISNSVKSFWQDVLNHPSQELACREGFMLDLFCFVVAVPVADSLSIVCFNSANRDRRRDDILCQVLCQPLSSGGHLSRLQESHKALGVFLPCTVNVFFDGWIGNLFSEHGQKVVLPFSVHDVVGDIGNRFPLVVFVKSAGGHEDMKMGVVMAGASGGLENDDVSHVEVDAGTGVEDVFETGMTRSHQWAQQCGVAVEPCSQELGHGQYDMAIGDAGQKPPADEVGPSVGISLGTGQAEAGFAGKGDTSYFATLAASVLDKAHLVGITAVEHFLDGVVVIRTVKSWMNLLKRIPMIVKNLLKRVSVNTFHGCSLRTTIPN